MLLGLVGVSGAGKTYFKEKIVEKLGFEKVNTIRTRQKRNEEQEGTVGFFRTEEELDKLNREGKIIYQGEINLTFMYQETTSSRIGVKSLVEPFEYTVTSQTITTKTKIDTNIEIAKQDFVVTADSNVEVKIDLNFRLNLSNERELRLIDNIEEAKESNRETFSIVIYYTKEGDTLWNIAKKFGSTVDEIIKVNNIENPDVIMPGEQLFIPR